MAVIPPHQPIDSWEDWRDTHRHEERIPFPRRNGHIGELIALHWFKSSEVDDLPLSGLVLAALTREDVLWLIGIIWSQTRPLHKYPIPALWVCGRSVVRL
ncbi:MAG: hypothetical protein AAFY29_10965 [Pseudomonadota bacterium]